MSRVVPAHFHTCVNATGDPTGAPLNGEHCEVAAVAAIVVLAPVLVKIDRRMFLSWLGFASTPNAYKTTSNATARCVVLCIPYRKEQQMSSWLFSWLRRSTCGPLTWRYPSKRRGLRPSCAVACHRHEHEHSFTLANRSYKTLSSSSDFDLQSMCLSAIYP